ncbi:polyribonucleotide nucleotidyltransferase [Candidatus Uhrbacteria bacterium CG_4_9_14_0_2_um_filter_41_50]|uniref:Polyribonucleotide nucleotidyltransferase n=1 Tax=Candidatus Uhrbacteria bacterium CG_4_9_14_0_2_um_filter_41_50 TaxID=1975031 RepID=A0A2M8EN39_9BACT|nr:MAG: polyribonucleotide nucleotidyltransferase [Candidatus Uhrbacteria bacterium CG_4_10_14_3_um_filter_41_21]PIZ55177.1 MAG: polyribonucleotide nucleotidyltransferase [Candidatus Uhrbacteria bacterium CG_4_10_14_0_2_um_filter_41_21]PJB84885.1 MAG: polyribonucleotide nucleotidyltransferase [Candidatus Uhrbacteria bacterium CG_4_9_14_0_8_um_filter_41_16]PJC24145.1 MAG: polyribonucleotide nucleotidyltransferase [Candidatus Uhrbacteria bacterium CG_4_9_14_0_2_um_filter_41_50]PJE75034.1 MAG: pol
MTEKTFSANIGGKDITIETGKFAQSANASCTVRCGDTVLLATAVMSHDSKEGMGYFPLMVDYEEKMYAAGRIKGSRFIKREGRPTDEAVLVGRFIDRAIRPLFDERMTNEVQVIITVLAFDGENDPDILGLIGASCVLHMSDIPWNGPIGAARISKIGSDWLVNPTYEQRLTTEFDLDIAGTAEKTVMIEARGNEASKEDFAEAFDRGSKELANAIKLIERVRKEVGIEKLDVLTPKTDEAEAKLARKEEIQKMAAEFMTPVLEKIYSAGVKSKKELYEVKDSLKDQLTEYLKSKELESDEIKIGTDMIYNFAQDIASKMILEKGQRVDGRKLDEIRPLIAEVALLPRVHGSSHFSRGITQVLNICTLGAPGDEQTLDGMETVGQKRFIHHYNFPPFSVGEAKFLRGAGRREVGHGALAEKALEPMIPSKADFPYSIRLVSEVLNSNGSSSMASTCASTLALMDAGVPIKAPVAGIAMGLASDGTNWKVLTDLQDVEDGKGGMDFKITGSRKGITAIQMDTKTNGLTADIIKEALERSNIALNQILDVIEKAIPKPRADLSPNAPRIITLQISPDKIKDVIGSGGKTINEIIDKTGVDSIDIEQDGQVFITASNKEAADKAYEWVNNLTRDVEVGEAFVGKVVRLMDFGAFIQILPGKDGMVHISELAPWRVGNVEDIVKLGDEVHVKVIEIDDQGRINLSMSKAEGNVYTDEMKTKAQKLGESSGAPRRPSGGDLRGGGPRGPHRPRS